jgi:(p)ppGpp synthase/HD superfamily hydrolase
VAGLLSRFTDDPALLAAAFLHDVLEDCGLRRSDLAAVFSPAIAGLVQEVSRDPQAQGNRDARDNQYLGQLVRASDGAQTIKLADIADNCKDLPASDPWSLCYVKKQKTLAEVLIKGHSAVRRIALDRIQDTVTRITATKGRT